MNRKLRLDELQRLSVTDFKNASKTPLVVVLDNIRSLTNIGGIFRTADAYRIHSVVLCGITAQPPHRDIQKTALGATESVDWSYQESAVSAVENLRAKGFKVWAIEQTEGAHLLDAFEPDNSVPHAIVMGNEVAGVQQEVIDACNGCLELPQFGTKHSLNVGVCAGIVMWELWKKLENKKAPSA